MKSAIALLMVLSAATAQAQLVVPTGSKGTLKVEYVYNAAGRTGTESGGAIDEWKVRRVINITANYEAEVPQPLGRLHKIEASQQASIEKKNRDVQAFAKKMEPTMNDMMKIAERCGESEACIEKAIAEYGNTMDKSEIEANKKTAAGLGKPDEPRYQMWRAKSQTGTYLIDELITRQVFEMTCTRTQVCKRTTTSKGSGDITQPAGRPIEGTTALEFDMVTKDLAVVLPSPLAPLKVENTATTSIIDDEVSAGSHRSPKVPDFGPINVVIPGNELKASGTRTIKGTGQGAESGTLTVTWTFTRL